MTAAAMGVVSFLTCCIMQLFTYQNGGYAELRYGAVVFVCLIISVAGLITAILSGRDPDVIPLVPALGMILNGAVLVYGFVVVYYGM